MHLEQVMNVYIRHCQGHQYLDDELVTWWRHGFRGRLEPLGEILAPF